MANANRIEKEKQVADLAQKFGSAQAAVITQCTGITVEKITGLRAKLRKQGIEFKVVKNTLAMRASEGTSLEILKDQFVGPTAISITDKDPVLLAKVLLEFVKSEEKFVIRKGMLNGTLLDKAQVEALSKVPSREVLLARLVGALQMPYAGLVYSLSGILRKLVYALDAVRRKKEVQGR